jgi:hypothetical protein
VSEADWTPHFRPDERLLWEGAPQPGFHQPGKSLFLMAFGLPFLLAGIGVVAFGLQRLHAAPTASDAGLAVFAAAFGLPFAAIGAFLVLGPVHEALLAPRRLRYALTSRAAYIFRHTLSRKLEVYPITPTTSLELEKGKGADTVWFHTRLEQGPDGPATAHVGFRNIADGDRVFQLIRGIQGKDDA